MARIQIQNSNTTYAVVSSNLVLRNDLDLVKAMLWTLKLRMESCASHSNDLILLSYPMAVFSMNSFGHFSRKSVTFKLRSSQSRIFYKKIN